MTVARFSHEIHDTLIAFGVQRHARQPGTGFFSGPCPSRLGRLRCRPAGAGYWYGTGDRFRQPAWPVGTSWQGQNLGGRARPPARMITRGLTLDQIRIGDTVEVYGYPHRSREVEMRAEWIRVHDKITQLR